MPALAQTVTPTAGTGNVGTTISNTGSYTVTGGTQRINTLFHSFEDFSPETTNVLFQLDAGQSAIEYVISRVTGNNLSLIDGQLALTGGNNPDLFLINPNGMTFGPNASLFVPGSFFVSTADSITFREDQTFSSDNPSAAPLLTMSAPMGLQFGTSAHAIDIDQSSLIVNPGEALGFLGGDLQIAGGYLNTESGQLSLGSVAQNSRVGLDSNTFEMNYADTTGFQEISLTQGTFADVSGDGGGSFQIQGQIFQISEGSGLEASNTGATDGGTSSIRTVERVEAIGTDTFFDTTILVDVYGTGRGNHLLIETDQFLMSRAAFVATSTFDQGASGNITLNANDVFIVGNPDGDADSTLIATGSFGPGDGGDFTVTAEQLVVENSGQIFSDAFGQGDGGDMLLNVDQISFINGGQGGPATFGEGNSGDLIVVSTDFVEMVGSQSFARGFFSSGLFASAEPGSTGNAGAISITTPRLRIVQGGKIAVNTVGEGNGGNLVIRADEIDVADPIVDFTGAISGLVANVVNGASGDGGSLDIETTRLNVFNGGQITASTEGAGNAGTIGIRAAEVNVWGDSDDGNFRSEITSSSTTSFDAGSIKINSDRLTVEEGGAISVSSLAGGNAGNLNITSDSLYLNNGTLQALATAGDQGNIALDATSVLLMRQGSQITTSATDTATGGNITLQAPVIVGIENSDISANAVFGSGGNIDIITQNLLGLEFRNEPTLESDITASSQFGVSGTVDINNLTLDPSSALVELPEAPADVDNQITSACAASDGNQFIASGRGGLPVPPTTQTSGHRPWSDVRDMSAFLPRENIEPSTTVTLSTDEKAQVTEPAGNLVEATRWNRATNGQVALLANESDVSAKTVPVSCLI
ncbi:MAG: S-layer family protein [Cyanobacteria bacterium P01_F01_bin.53]